MKKTAVMALSAIVAAMSLGVAAPARAQSCTSVPPLPTSNTVRIENGQIRIDPNGPGEDAEDLQGYADVRVGEAWTCGFNAVPPQGWCAANLALNAAFNEYTYQDPYSGEVVIDYGRLVADTGCLL